MPEANNDASRETRRILEGVKRDSEAYPGGEAGPGGPDENWTEIWGRRIGRTLGTAFAVALIVWLVAYLARPG